MATSKTDLLIVGAGLGGIAAALTAADAGCTVTLVTEEPMIGGQVTTQAVSPLDEHPHIETTGASNSYQEFRRRIRAHHGGRTNPGGGWVSRLCFTPAAGLQVLTEMLDEHLDAGRIRLHTSYRPTHVHLDASDEAITAVSFDVDGHEERVEARIVIDATELGDLLMLSGAEWRIGSEGREAFGESNALASGPDPLAEQSCTWVAALRIDPEARHLVAPSTRYDHWREQQPFGLEIPGWDGTVHRYRMFEPGPTGRPPFWTYRRVHDAAQLGGRDVAVINWASNDYVEHGLVGNPSATRDGARQLTLDFIHWLQTEAPRDDGGYGYPEFQLAPDVVMTDDGLAVAPYVRESRRIASSTPITGCDLLPADGYEHAPIQRDSLGTAWYHMDFHARVGHPGSAYIPTAPFQIPAHALVTQPGRGPANLLAGAKNLAATQAAAAAYRVHPGEWGVGEAAAAVAVTALQCRRSPRTVATSGDGVLATQRFLLSRGTPLLWALDVAPNHPCYEAMTFAVLAGAARGERATGLTLIPDALPTTMDRVALAEAFGLDRLPEGRTWADAAHTAWQASGHHIAEGSNA